MLSKLALPVLLLTCCGLVIFGCGKSTRSAADGTTIRVEGSDTMVNLAQAWAERYRELHPAISVPVLGGGSGVGIASLIEGNCDLAAASREIQPKEIARLKAERQVEPQIYVVGHDALAVYIHRDNPLEKISLEELAEIYGEDGKITRWSQLGVTLPGNDTITRVSRQNSSGTYAYFREAVLGKGRDYKLGSIDQSGSKDVVALVSHTPNAIGYSGMGYATEEVKMLAISRKKGEPGAAPTAENAKQNSYPLTRALYLFTPGEPAGAVKEYLDWIFSAEGQKIVLELGYVPAKS